MVDGKSLSRAITRRIPRRKRCPKNPNSLQLNHYGNNATDAFLLRFAQFLKGRLGLGFDSMYSELNHDTIISGEGKKQGKGILLSDHLLAEAESGWDFTRRFNARCESIAPVDLNCLLYLSEKTIANGYKILHEHKNQSIGKSAYPCAKN